MCGIIGAVAQRNVIPILLEGLNRLEYRGYDSAGLVTVNGGLRRVRSVGRVASLAEETRSRGVHGHLGIAHTRWATHGAPTEANAHPHVSHDEIAVVHNGIIENHGMKSWAELIAEERMEVRKRYKMLRSLPPEKRREILRKWAEYDSLSEEEKASLRQAHPAPATKPKPPN